MSRLARLRSAAAAFSVVALSSTTLLGAGGVAAGAQPLGDPASPPAPDTPAAPAEPAIPPIDVVEPEMTLRSVSPWVES